MTTFTLKGPRGNQTIEMTWTDGKLSGDPDAIEMVQMMATAAEGYVISSAADITSHNHLDNPFSASSLMRMVFSGRPVCTYSDVEPVPPPPEGAVM